MLSISARLRMHEYSAYEPRPHLFTAVIIIWQAQNSVSALASLPAYRSSKTPDKLCVLRDLYGVAILKLVLGHVH